MTQRGVKISADPLAAPLAGDESFPALQDGDNVRVTPEQLRDFILDTVDDPAIASINAAGATQRQTVVDKGAEERGLLEAARDQALNAFGTAADDIGIELSVAASPTVFDTKANLVAGVADNQHGHIPEAFGVRGIGYWRRGAIAAPSGRNILLGGGARAAIKWAALRSTVVTGTIAADSTIFIDFARLAFTNGRIAENLMVTPPPMTFTFVTAQAMTATGPVPGAIDMRAVRLLTEDDPLTVEIEVAETFTAVGAGNMTLSLIGSAAADLSAPTTLVTNSTLGKGAYTAGTKFRLQVPGNMAQQYLGASTVITSGPMTAGKFTVRLICDSGRVAPNYFVFDGEDGQIRNQSGGPTRGAKINGGRRFTFTNGQTLALQAGDYVAPPGETWSMEIVTESAPGAGAQAARFGPTTGATIATSGAMAEGVKLTSKATFDGSDAALPKITTTVGSSLDVIIHRIRAIPGTLFPDYVDGHDGHAIGSFQTDGRMGRRDLVLSPRTPTGNRVTIANKGLRRKAINTKIGHTFIYTVFVPPPPHGNDWPLCVPIYDTDGAATISSSSMAMLVDNFMGPGEFSLRPDQSSSSASGYVEPRPGWHVLAWVIEDRGVTLYDNCAPILRSYTPQADLESLGYWLSAYGATMNMAPSTGTTPGVEASTFQEIPRGLDQDQLMKECSVHRAILSEKGYQLAIDPYFFIRTGTSNNAWTSLPAAFWQLVTMRILNADGTPRYQGINAAHGGMSYHNVQAPRPLRAAGTAVRVSNVTRFRTATANTYSTGDVVKTYGLSDPSFERWFSITVPSFTLESAANEGAVRVAGVTTFKTTAAHGRSAGDLVRVTISGGATFSGIFTVVSAPTANTFTVANPGVDAITGTGSVVTVDEFTVANPGPDATAVGGFVIARRYDFFAVLEAEVIPAIRGRRWQGAGKTIVYLPDYTNDHDYIGSPGGPNPSVLVWPDPPGWDPAKTGAENVLECYVKTYAARLRAELVGLDAEIWSHPATPRTDATGVASGYSETGRNLFNTLLANPALLGVVYDRHFSHAGTDLATSALAAANGAIGGDGIHQTPYGGAIIAGLEKPFIEAM